MDGPLFPSHSANSISAIDNSSSSITRLSSKKRIQSSGRSYSSGIVLFNCDSRFSINSLRCFSVFRLSCASLYRLAGCLCSFICWRFANIFLPNKSSTFELSERYSVSSFVLIIIPSLLLLILTIIQTYIRFVQNEHIFFFVSMILQSNRFQAEWRQKFPKFFVLCIL